MLKAMDSSPKFRFGPYELDASARELYKHGTRLKLRGQPYQILEVLLDRAGVVVTREEIRERLWPADTYVDFEHGLNTSIKKLRQILCDSATEPQFIETVPRLGYRFIAAVEVSRTSTQPVADSRPSSRIETNAVSEVETGATREPGERSGPPSYWKVIAGGLALILGAVLVLDMTRTSSGMPTGAGGTAKPFSSLAVLPLQNLSNNPEQEYFADGMTDELITDLAQLGTVRVISRTSAMQYRGQNKSVSRIGKELGVDALIEGTVERVGDRVRIRVQLIDCAADRHLWAKSYDREVSDVLLLESAAAHDIAEEIQGEVILPQLNAASTAAHPVNTQAYDAYLKGRYFWNRRSPEDLKKSIDYFDEAITEDPGLAPAYAGLADAYSILGSDVLPADLARNKAHVAVSKALELNPSLAEGHATLGLLEFYYDWDWSKAQQEFLKAIELNPNYATAHQWYSGFLTAMGRFPEAVLEARRAQQLDPLSLPVNTTLASKYFYVHQYDLAVELNQKTLDLDPNFVPAHMALASEYEAKGMLPEADAEAKKALDLSHGSPRAMVVQGNIYADSGRLREARSIVKELEKRSGQRYISAFEIAEVYASLGDLNSAFGCLETSYRQRESQMPFLNVDYRLRSLRSDPRFADLMKRMNLPQ
jgi:TolB-like protein/DNA-binding winged helix-turn-helix (wHTH) protein/Flp pilus assembly protein TadD